jgi:hypothetical protein
MSIAQLIFGFIIGFLGLIGLLMTACGGYVTFASLLNKGSSNSYTSLSVPSLVVGLVLVLLAVAYFRAAVKGQQKDDDQ